MSILKELTKSLQFKFASSFEYAQPNIRVIGIMGVIGFPLFYFVWRYGFPQPYENLWIRLLGSLIYTPLVFHRSFRKWFRNFEYYWIFCVWFATCFFFPYMLFKNELNQIWITSNMSGLLLLVFVAYDLKILIGLYISGFLITFFILAVEGNWPNADIIIRYAQYQPIYFFLFFLGSSTNQTKERIIVEKHRTVLSVGKNMAHEIRSPLVSIHCAIEGLQKHLEILGKAYQFALSDKRTSIRRIHPLQYQQLFNIPTSIKREVKYANSTIDMLLFNANKNFLDNVNFSNQCVLACVQSVISSYPFKNEAESKSIHCDVEDFVFRGNDTYLRNVLFNLINNALYYIAEMQKGSIFITSSTKDFFKNELIFKDTAKGIPKENCEVIFQPFFTQNKHGGTGIGLSLCKQVMESFRGGISCESVEGKYTLFRLSFPKIR